MDIIKTKYGKVWITDSHTEAFALLDNLESEFRIIIASSDKTINGKWLFACADALDFEHLNIVDCLKENAYLKKDINVYMCSLGFWISKADTKPLDYLYSDTDVSIFDCGTGYLQLLNDWHEGTEFAERMMKRNDGKEVMVSSLFDKRTQIDSLDYSEIYVFESVVELRDFLNETDENLRGVVISAEDSLTGTQEYVLAPSLGYVHRNLVSALAENAVVGKKDIARIADKGAFYYGNEVTYEITRTCGKGYFYPNGKYLFIQSDANISLFSKLLNVLGKPERILDKDEIYEMGI